MRWERWEMGGGGIYGSGVVKQGAKRWGLGTEAGGISRQWALIFREILLDSTSNKPAHRCTCLEFLWGLI